METAKARSQLNRVKSDMESIGLDDESLYELKTGRAVRPAMSRAMQIAREKAIQPSKGNALLCSPREKILLRAREKKLRRF